MVDTDSYAHRTNETMANKVLHSDVVNRAREHKRYQV